MTESNPLLVADSLCLRTKRGWVFRDVDLTVEDGSLTVLAGPSGSGRTMLLLALAGRAKPSSGTLWLRTEEGGAEYRRPRLRSRIGVARITGVAELEPDLRVVDHRREAALLAGESLDHPWAAGVLGLDIDGAAYVSDLAADDATLLAVALAAAGKPPVLVIDDIDAGVTPEQQQRVWKGLAELAAHGTAIVASAHSAGIAEPYGASVHALTSHTEEGTHARV